MQGLCRLSRRWHQQFCQSPSFGPHWHCFQPYNSVRGLRQGRKPSIWQPTTTAVEPPKPVGEYLGRHESHPLSPSQLLSNEGDDLVVREFEQFRSDKTSRKQIEPNKELNDEVHTVWEELQDVERRLRVAREGPFGRQTDFMKQLTNEQREELLKTLTEEGLTPQDEDDALDLAEIDRLMEEDKQDVKEENNLSITLHIPKAHQVLVNHFNRALNEVQSEEDSTAKNLNLWKWYLRCQQNVPGFSRIIPQNIWDRLWTSQSQLQVRPQHLVMLGKDILAASQSMSQEQSLEYIKALHSYGQTSEALTVWEEAKSHLASETENNFLSDFYSTGVQLYASMDRPQRCQNIALSAINEGVNPQILIHVISGWARHKTAEAATKAWAVYIKMRILVGDDMTTELYDEVSNALLSGNHGDMALAAFKDMIVGIQGSGPNTLHVYHKVLGNLRSDGDPGQIEKAINEVSLTMLLALPKQYQNKFFFASWIKKLLGQQRIEAASMVVDLMYERNIRPDAIHLNGIIGAWLRGGEPSAQEKAVKLAWEMIQARVNQGSEREQNASLRRFDLVFRKVMPFKEGNNPWLEPVRLERPVPQANVETFSLLFDYHEQRHQWHQFQQLTQTMIGPAQLKPNTFIMNKWLAAELGARAFDRFWALFNGLADDIKPDLETFDLAWQVRATSPSSFGSNASPSYRRLFASMMKWAWSLERYRLGQVRKDFNEKLYADIMRSFCQQLDLPGTICAITGMHRAFAAFPNDVAVQLITGQIARLLPRTDPAMPVVRGRRRANARFSQDQTTLKHIADIVDTLEAQMKIERVENGKATPEELEGKTSTQAKKLRLDVMTEFLIIMMRKLAKETDDPVKRLHEAAGMMKVNISQLNLDVGLE